MSIISYHVLWPGGNTTAIVSDLVPREQYITLAKQLLAADSALEQVGFIEPPTLPSAAIRLHMMGGEFCGNAARAAVHLCTSETNEREINLEVSGFSELIRGRRTGEETAVVLPGSFVQASTKIGGHYIIDLFGIRQVVVPATAAISIEEVMQKYAGIFPAVGLMRVSPLDRGFALDPIVWVRDTNTCYNETACGSGSIAVAIAAAKFWQAKPEVVIRQPSGEDFTVIMSHASGGDLKEVLLTGKTKYLGQRSLSWG